MKYQTIMLYDSLFISMSQFVAIPSKAFWVSFSKEKQSQIMHSHLYQKLTLNTKKKISVAATLKHS